MRFKQVQRFIWAQKNILGLGALKYSCSRREEMFGVTMISTIFLANEKFVKNLLVSMNEWKGQLYIYELSPEGATRSDILYLFAKGNINFIRE